MTEILNKILRQQKQMNDRLTELSKLVAPPCEIYEAPQTWVSVRFIQDLTGWDSEDLREVRKQNIMVYRKNAAGGYEYLLESLNDKFIKQKY